VDITQRASRLFDDLIVAVYDAPPKSLMFTTEERVDFFAKSVSHLPNVQVTSFSGLSPHYAREVDAEFIVRGLRAGFDFEMEFEMALMWRSLAPDIDVVCMMSSLEYQFVYSSRVKEVAMLGGNVDGLVPAHVAAALRVKSGQSR
jgi:pantetheine-phosphate adenylyltransferase